jgi:hypothetical protein
MLRDAAELLQRLVVVRAEDGGDLQGVYKGSGVRGQAVRPDAPGPDP